MGKNFYIFYPYFHNLGFSMSRIIIKPSGNGNSPCSLPISLCAYEQMFHKNRDQQFRKKTVKFSSFSWATFNFYITVPEHRAL